MKLIMEGKTNWKYILIILILAVVVGIILWRAAERKDRLGIIKRVPEGTQSGFVQEDKVVQGPLDRISITFSRNIDESALTKEAFYALQGIDEKILGTIEYDKETKTASLVFEKEIQGGSPGRETRITVIVEGIKDLEGNQIEKLLYNIDIIQNETTDWQTYIGWEYAFEFKYPEDFFWQKPEVIPINCDYDDFSTKCPFIPIEGLTLNREEAIEKGIVKIERTEINNVSYCLQEFKEGAAGSTYVTYYYISSKDEKCFAVNFVLRFTNCGVFGSPDDEAYKNCEYENSVTKPETLNLVVSTFNFIEDVKKVVVGFGNNLKNVSLLAPQEILEESIRENYGDFVSEQLILEWIDNPEEAPGRLTSSPWPERIEIESIKKVDDFYEVLGSVIEMTSVEVAKGGFSGKRPVFLKVENQSGKWLISNLKMTISEVK